VPDVRIVGCQPLNSPVMARSVAAGRILDMPSEPTLSDGTAGGIEADAITFELCRALVDEFVLVSEDEIAAAMRLIAESHHLIVEGSAGVAVAAYVQQAARFRGQDVVIVLTGANISPSAWRGVL
jgi:threonine dehydratase